MSVLALTALVALVVGASGLVLFVVAGRVVHAAVSGGVFAVATLAAPLALFVVLALAAVAGLFAAAPRWAGEAAGHAQGASRGFATALLLALPAVAAAAGVLFAQWQQSR